MEEKKIHKYRLDFYGEETTFKMLKTLLENTNNTNILVAKKLPERRSTNQNSALHLWLNMIAEVEKEKGTTLDALYRKPTEVPITETHLKMFAKDVVTSIGDHNNTSKLNKEDFSVLIEVLIRTFAERLQNTTPFPNKELI